MFCVKFCENSKYFSCCLKVNLWSCIKHSCRTYSIPDAMTFKEWLRICNPNTTKDKYFFPITQYMSTAVLLKEGTAWFSSLTTVIFLIKHKIKRLVARVTQKNVTIVGNVHVFSTAIYILIQMFCKKKNCQTLRWKCKTFQFST